MTNRKTVVRFPVFNGYEVRVILARDVKRTCRALQVLNASDEDLAAHVTHPDHPETSWLVFGTDPDPATIAHEASHAVRAVLAYAGARNDNETLAYHLDYLVGRIHKFIER